MQLSYPIPSTFRDILKSWRGRLGLLALLSIATFGIVVSQTVLPPEVLLPSEPLYENGAKTKGNFTLALSVEQPTLGQTYRDNFDTNKEYLGYFDPRACYRSVLSSSASTGGDYFDWQANKGTVSATCTSSQFDGNFMNWATSSAIDIMRYGLTGGNRTVDDASTTVVDRAWLPDDFYNNPQYFSEKFIPANAMAGRTELSPLTFPLGMWIYNCKNRVYFANAKDTNASGASSCNAPFGVAGALSLNLIKANANNKGNFYPVRNIVCDPNSASNRLITYDPFTKKWTGLCLLYPNGKYKPAGQFQVNSDNLRIAVVGYLQDNSRTRYGGVLRSPLKYLGPNNFDSSFNLQPTANARAEWDKSTGVFITNPQSGDATYGDQGYGQSGAINYINKFGTLNPNALGSYKILDPLSELYYEAVRYLQGNNQPTPDAISGLNGSSASVQLLTENFPAYRNWTDPFAGFVDSTGSGKGCLRNSIVTIADVFSNSDRSVPGNNIIGSQDFIRGAASNPALDAPYWTNVVGSFESNTTATSSVTYTDSQGITRPAGNLAGNQLYPLLSTMATMDTGEIGGSYYMAGLAYWANTQAFRIDQPKARITTYSLDVNQGAASSVVDFRRTRQLYLAAKYGGFDDFATNNTGNPYAGGTNAFWQGSDGDANNYYLVSDAAKFLDSLSELFAKVVEETGSIAGGAISTQRLTVGQTAAVFQARFNPVANFWSGRLLKYPLSLDATGTSLVIGSTATWEAGQVLTTDTSTSAGVAARNIVIGSPVGLQTTVAPTAFVWTAIAQEHKDALNATPYSSPATADTLGIDRLNYLRGDRTNELKPATPTAPFRPRDLVLGDIVNSGLVFMGTPTSAISGADYKTFFDTNKSRRSVIFTNANDGMLHAFYNTDGKEAFAYIPGFIAGNLNKLTSVNYKHFSINDSTPAIAEALVSSQWRSVLVSGIGGGGQGLYALDVTNPATFTKDNVLWEFTDRDSPAMGNVIGTPKIVKLRTTDFGTTAAYKWYAVVASGINNYKADGFFSTTGNPSIFIIDLSNPRTTAWSEGTNFWRIELPQSSTAIAKGLVGFTTAENFLTGATDSLYAGDMQGNVWKLDFTLKGTVSLTNNATTNLTRFNYKVGTSNTLFVAKDSASVLQPITGEPVITNAFAGNKLVSFGTGKYLEVADTTVPSAVTNTFYTLLDNGSAITGRSVLQQGSVSSTGTVTVPAFTFGPPPATGTSTFKLGWYFDMNKSIGEQQVSDITGAAGQLFFGSLFPTQGSCGEGGGRFYALNALTGNGISEISQVGILAAPLILEIGNTSLTNSDTSGQRTATRKIGVITQGSKGLKVAATSSGGTNLSYTQQVGRLSWRQMNNFQENKNTP